MGSFIRKPVFEALYEVGFNTIQVGRKGSAMSGGEDLEMSLMVALLGYEIWTSPRLYFQHYIPKYRIRKQHLEKTSIGNGKAISYEVPYVLLLEKENLPLYKRNIFYFSLSALWRYLRHALSGGYHHRLKAIEYRVYFFNLLKISPKISVIQSELLTVIQKFHKLFATKA